MVDSLNLTGPPSLAQVLTSIGCVALVSFGYFLVCLCQVRMMFRRVQKEHGLPMLPHSIVFGHIWTIAKLAIQSGQPRDLNGHWIFLQLQLQCPSVAECGLMYLDMWPVMYPMLVVFHPEMQSQFTQVNSQPKFWAQGQKEFKPYTNGEDIIHLEGREWKHARAMFNPGFSAKNLLSMIPIFIEEVLVFRQRLREAAQTNKTVKLQELTTNVTIDVIGRAVLGTRFHQQSAPNPLIATFNKQLTMVHLEMNLAKTLNPINYLANWLYNRRIRQQLDPCIRDTVRDFEKIQGPQTILSLAVKSFMSDVRSSSARGTVLESFIDRTIKHIKIFVFAGHDTSASALAFAYWMLYRNPDKAAILRAEHDDVLGHDPNAAADHISEDPTLLNKLPYTLAVFKETLRLFPPVGGSVRQTPEDFFLVHPETGKRYPTHGFMLHSSVSTNGRDARYWPRPHDFVPERWTVHDQADPLYAARNAWRPFEVGPRACIGKELVSLEFRLILALTMREFDFESAYEEGAPTWMGEVAYQMFSPECSATARPKDMMPVRVKARH